MTISAGSTSATLQFTSSEDLLYEEQEYVQLMLSLPSPVEGVSLGYTDTATMFIDDDEGNNGACSIFTF